MVAYEELCEAIRRWKNGQACVPEVLEIHDVPVPVDTSATMDYDGPFEVVAVEEEVAADDEDARELSVDSVDVVEEVIVPDEKG